MQERGDDPPATLRAVASADPVSFIAALMLFCTLAIVVAIFIHSQVTGIQPKESWTEIVVGVMSISAVFMAAIIYRARSINRLLGHGTRQAARVDRYVAVGVWVIVQLQYEWNGIQAERRIWLANSKRSRRLADKSAVILAMDPAAPGRFVIADVFVFR